MRVIRAAAIWGLLATSWAGCAAREHRAAPASGAPAAPPSDAAAAAPDAERLPDASAPLPEAAPRDSAPPMDAPSDGDAGDAGPDSSDATAPRDAAAGSDGAVVANPEPLSSRLPSASKRCPIMSEGTVEILGVHVVLSIGQRIAGTPRALVLYYHPTGVTQQPASMALGAELGEQLLREGGVIAAQQESSTIGESTGTSDWYTGDFAVADEVVACAHAQLNIDPSRIYAAGGMGGGLHAGAMLYARSAYLAAVWINPGGVAYPAKAMLQEPRSLPALMAVYAAGASEVVIDFGLLSRQFTSSIAAGGGVAVQCPHPAAQTRPPAELFAAGWAFLKAHPFGVTPKPYAGGLPASFPSYCKLARN